MRHRWRTSNSAVADPIVWSCLLLFLCTLGVIHNGSTVSSRLKERTILERSEDVLNVRLHSTRSYKIGLFARLWEATFLFRQDDLRNASLPCKFIDCLTSLITLHKHASGWRQTVNCPQIFASRACNGRQASKPSHAALNDKETATLKMEKKTRGHKNVFLLLKVSRRKKAIFRQVWFLALEPVSMC